MITEADQYFTAPIERQVVAEESKKAEKEQEPDKEQDSAPSKPWTPEEITTLTKGLAKYPVGTRERYEKVSEMLGTRSVKEVIAQTNLSKSETAKGH